MINTELEKKYRQAEIIHRGPLAINGRLVGIICRNEVERQTLLNLMRQESNKLFSVYHSIVVVRQDCFENNALFIDDCNYFENKIVLSFSKTYSKRSYVTSHRKNTEQLLVNARAELDYMRYSKLINRQGCDFIIDYERTNTITFTNIAREKGATSLHLKIYFEDKLVCYKCWQLSEGAML